MAVIAVIANDCFAAAVVGAAVVDGSAAFKKRSTLQIRVQRAMFCCEMLRNISARPALSSHYCNVWTRH